MAGKFKVMICDAVAPEAVEILKKCDQMEVDVMEGQSEDELVKSIPPYHACVVRSSTKITAKVFEAASNLKVVGRAGVGIDNVDVDMANRKGVIVMNTPGGNTVSTAEQTMTLMLALSRNVAQAVSAMRAGRWDRKKFKGTEVFGKTLGIIGLGRIGTQVAIRAQAFGMKTIGSDPFATEDHAKKHGIEFVSVDDVFTRSDYITIHTPMTDETRGIIGREAIEKMKPGVRIINCARGGLVDEKALADALEAGKVAGAALDVFEEEPLPPESSLLKYDNCITTPHLGASTEEAQVNVAIQVAEQIRDALLDVEVRNAINIPYVPPEALAAVGPYTGLAEKLGCFVAQLMDKAVTKVEVVYSGELCKYDLDPLNRAVLKGVLTPVCGDIINYINAPVILRDRGILLAETKSDSTEGYQNLVTVRLSGEDREVSASGTIFRRNDPRIVRVDEYHVDAKPVGHMLVLRNEDAPGIIGNVGQLLGDAGINISDMTLGRKEKGGMAVTVLNVDADLTPAVLKTITSAEHVICARKVNLG